MLVLITHLYDVDWDTAWALLPQTQMMTVGAPALDTVLEIHELQTR